LVLSSVPVQRAVAYQAQYQAAIHRLASSLLSVLAALLLVALALLLVPDVLADVSTRVHLQPETVHALVPSADRLAP